MEFGTFLLLQSPSAESPGVVFQRGVEITQAADELGFGNMWLAEHHFSTYGYLSRPLPFAVHLANKTQRIRVGTAVIVLPLHALAGKPFSYDGHHYQIPETSIFPHPIQKPHPPIWITAQSPESVEATVKRGFNLLSGGFGVPVERLREFREAFDGWVAEYRPKQPIRVGAQRPVYVTGNEADARAAAEHARWNMRVTLSLRHNYSRVESGRAIPVPFADEPSTDDILDKFSIIGTPDSCICQIRRLREAMGIDHFNCSFWFGDLTQNQVLRSMRLFAEEVMPAFR